VRDSFDQSQIQAVLNAVQAQLPAVEIRKKDSADPLANNNVWFLRWKGTEVSIGSQPEGKPPFLVDRYGKDVRVREASRAADLIVSWLSTS
jgi:hypothetical protein